MSQVLPVALQALQNDTSSLERIALNLANTATPAYRREIAVQGAVLPVSPLPFGAVVDAQAGAQAGALAGDATPDALSTPASALHFDTRHGTFKTTGAPLDVALAGQGFFEIGTDQGPAYTRNGQWQRDARGRLVTAQGHPVMGRAGEITLTPSAVTIDATGHVFQDGKPVDQLRVVQLDDTSSMTHAEAGLFRSESPARPLDGTDLQVRQGALENSNVDPMTEMVGMVQVMRHFETMARIVQNYDDMMGTAIRKLGEF